ncbi:hypothetical protein A6U98_03230 [Rhizobium sp. WYCCWR10014]|uniref:RHS repeat domain-containing protein n=1 Tax=Rhizobium sp. WYCCWR10014 TaxID=1825933 RepID=UPI0007E33E20|nr:hypothetical protein [Rhizobium sp. WYCCWR10014]OAV54485.1 hypothetical protein A6U98_03230 [Rhizobium sp. WYCCWR10014]
MIKYLNGVTTTFTYSPTRRWLDRVTTAKGTTVLMDNQYTRDRLGRITKIVGPDEMPTDSWEYSYDDLSRLTKADNAGDNTLDEAYSYDTNHNLLSRSRIGASGLGLIGSGAIKGGAAGGASLPTWGMGRCLGAAYIRPRDCRAWLGIWSGETSLSLEQKVIPDSWQGPMALGSCCSRKIQPSCRSSLNFRIISTLKRWASRHIEIWADSAERLQC